jgi:signal peptidase I
MENKPRKPWIAGLLSVIQPGLGQIYNGEIRKAVIIYFLPILVLTTAIILCLNGDVIRFILISSTLLIPFYYIFVFIDAYRTAKKYSNQYSLKKYNNVIAYIGICLLVSIVSNSLFAAAKHNVVQAYKFPSGSMEPTLLNGDQILVDRTKSARNPNKGDIIVFEYPEDPSKDFVKRVIAVGGETVEVKNKALYVNGKVMAELYVVHNDVDIFPASQNPRDYFGPHVVPSGSYFVMGDNRDKSYCFGG